jgi:hypothetical protein
MRPVTELRAFCNSSICPGWSLSISRSLAGTGGGGRGMVETFQAGCISKSICSCLRLFNDHSRQKMNRGTAVWAGGDGCTAVPYLRRLPVTWHSPGMDWHRALPAIHSLGLRFQGIALRVLQEPTGYRDRSSADRHKVVVERLIIQPVPFEVSAEH